MTVRPRTIAVLAALAGLATFCVVQDRVAAAGARRYAAMQRTALAGAGPPVSIDEVMRPAIAASVWQGLEWGGGVAIVGLAAAGAVARRRNSHAGTPNSRTPTPSSQRAV